MLKATAGSGFRPIPNASGLPRLITNVGHSFPCMTLFCASGDRQNGTVRSGTIPRLSSILWAVSWLVLAGWLCWLFSWMRQFDTSFDAHNKIHWFRRVAVLWFSEYSLIPSVVVAALILFRDTIRLNNAALTYSLLAVCAFPCGAGLYTVFEHFKVMHHFVL